MSYIFRGLNPEQQHHLIDGAELFSEDEHESRFYDTETHRLTLSNIWLRRHDDDFELKVPIARSYKGSTLKDRYVELTDEHEMREVLRMPSVKLESSFEEDLLDAGFAAFCTARIIKRTYVKGLIAFDIHNVTYDGSNFSYTLTESHKLSETNEKDGLNTSGRISGSAVLRIASQYLKQHNEGHYYALVANYVVS